MREQSSRSLLFILAAVWIVSLFFFMRQSNDEPPPGDETAQATPSVDLNLVGTQKVEEAGIQLAIQSDSESTEVVVGTQLSYTVIVENATSSAITPVVTNILDPDLVLETGIIETSNGEVTIEGNGWVWQGEIEQDGQAIISYKAHPNYFSEPNQTLNNTVSLRAGSQTLQTKVAIVNTRTFWKLPIIGITRVLEYLAGLLEGVGLPYAYGFSIIFFTVAVRAATFPLNKKQIESTKATQEIQPKLKELQKKYGDDREKMAQEQMRLYKEYGVNPLGGCLPLIVQMPIWLSLYRALFHMANDTHDLDAGFFWIPSLAGPVGPITTGFSGGIDWLIPWGTGFLGWGPAIAYLVLPVLLVVTQLFMQKMMTPQTDDPQQKMMGQVMMFMPFMFGYFALVVPSGLSLYWFTSNVLGIAQQHYMMKAKEDMGLGKKDEEVDTDNAKNASLRQLEVSPATATIDSSTDTEKQGKNNATTPRTKSKRKRKRKK